MKPDKALKRLKKSERGYRRNKNADSNFNRPKAMGLYILFSLAFSIFASWCAHGPYMNANAGAHVMIFMVVFGLLLALSRVILNIICAFVRLFTLPAYRRHKKCEKILFGDEPRIRSFGEYKEPEVGLRYFIESEKMDVYNIRFLD